MSHSVAGYKPPLVAHKAGTTTKKLNHKAEYGQVRCELNDSSPVRFVSSEKEKSGYPICTVTLFGLIDCILYAVLMVAVFVSNEVHKCTSALSLPNNSYELNAGHNLLPAVTYRS